MSEDSTPNFHPSYSFPDADLVLTSSDGVNFRVHSLIMKLASRMFRGMLEGSYDSGEAIVMQEGSTVLEAVLAIVYPDKACAKVCTFDGLEQLAFVAEKYDAPAVLAHARFLFFITLNPDYLPTYLPQAHPLEMYRLACQYGWEEEAKAASARTLETDLSSPEARRILEKTDTKSALKLLDLHQTRRDALDAAIQQRSFEATAPQSAIRLRHITTLSPVGCNHDPDQSCWNALRLCVSAEMRKCSAGKVFRSPHFWKQDDIVASGFWTGVCKRCHGHKLNRDRDITIDEFLRVLDSLPTTI